MALRATAAEPGLSESPHSWTGSSITAFLLNRMEGAIKEYPCTKRNKSPLCLYCTTAVNGAQTIQKRKGGGGNLQQFIVLERKRRRLLRIDL